MPEMLQIKSKSLKDMETRIKGKKGFIRVFSRDWAFMKMVLGVNMVMIPIIILDTFYPPPTKSGYFLPTVLS